MSTATQAPAPPRVSPPRRPALLDAAVTAAQFYAEHVAWPFYPGDNQVTSLQYKAEEYGGFTSRTRRLYDEMIRRIGEDRPRSARATAEHFLQRAGLSGKYGCGLSRYAHWFKPSPFPRPGVRDLYQELLMVEREFGGLAWDHADKRLTAVTEPIVLEGVKLGAFRLEVRFHKTAVNRYRRFTNSCLRVVAVTPNYSSRNGNTHPHVGGQRQLCFGDAGNAAFAAVNRGQLGDFFVLARAVLSTHYDREAYEPLEHWRQPVVAKCADCNAPVTATSLRRCATCEAAHCVACRPRDCPGCGRKTCTACRTVCDFCDTSFCPGCFVPGTPAQPKICYPCAPESLILARLEG